MSNLEKERIFSTKPYDVVGGVSIFPLNENGVKNYLKNKLVDNQIIKRYGTMDFLENCDLAREKKSDESKIFTHSKSFAVLKGKSSSDWNNDLILLKKKFKDDIVKMDNSIQAIKDKKSNSIICKDSTLIDQNNYSKNLSELTKKFSKMNSKDQITKNNVKRKLIDGFKSIAIPRLDTTDEKMRHKFFLKLMKTKNFEDSDLILGNSSNPITKPINICREMNYTKIISPWNLKKTSHPEFNYNDNIQGDCKMMGEKYNPFNYYVDNTRTTKRRNFYGSVFHN